eukprot:GGOE01043029.1.p1 GENE.GGOE01043029.1~~GGOE01043029.1.p1  ORF type:complete len:159 (-),score=32.79 GGOE01043029.1:321-776(-)
MSPNSVPSLRPGRSAASKDLALAALQRQHVLSLMAAVVSSEFTVVEPQPAAPSAHAARRANRSSHQAYFAIMRRQGQKHQTEGAHPTPEDTCEDAPSSPVVPLPLLEGSMAVVSPPRTPAMATGGWSPFEGPQWLPPRMVPTSLERPGQWA